MANLEAARTSFLQATAEARDEFGTGEPDELERKAAALEAKLSTAVRRARKIIDG